MSTNEIIHALEMGTARIAELNALLKEDRAELARLRAQNDQFSDNLGAVGKAYNAEKDRAERAEADTARLDWLSVSDVWFDTPATGAFTPETFRAAIDAAMKP